MSHGGQDAFDAILQRLPLSPQDFHVIGLASELAGWNESFLERPSAKSGRAKAKAKANGDQGQGQTDIGLALMSAAARPKAAPAPAPPPARPSGAVSHVPPRGGEGPPPTASSSGTWSYACSCPIGSSSPIGAWSYASTSSCTISSPSGSASGASTTTTSTRHAGG